MGVEIATFIADLVPAEPGSDDLVSQGDDHLRLMKQVLQNTFPGATAAYTFPKVVAMGASRIATVADQNTMFIGPAGESTLTLPVTSTLPGMWYCDAFKASLDGGGITVSPASGTIYSSVGSVASIRIGVMNSVVGFLWSGGSWFCLKSGAPIGSTINFDGASLPPGHLVLDGSAFDTAKFAELALALGSGTLPDKRGRIEAGVDGGTGRLTANAYGFGSSAILGAVGGLEYETLSVAELPSHYHTVTFTAAPAHTHNMPGYTTFVAPFAYPGVTSGGVAASLNVADTPTGSAGGGGSLSSSNGPNTTDSSGSGAAHRVVQPTIITQKLIKAC